MSTPFETLLDELEQADSRRRMAKSHAHGFDPKRHKQTRQQMAKAVGDLQALHRKTTKEEGLAKSMHLRQLYADARAEMANAIGQRPSHEIAAMESRLARAGEQLRAAGVF